MTFSTRNFDPLTPLAPNSQILPHMLLFRLKHTVAVVTHAHVLQNCYTTWVRGVACQKQHLRPKLEGVWARGTSQKNLRPLLISATVEASNFKLGMQLGFVTSLPKKQRLGRKLTGAWAREASEKICDPYLFLQPTEKLVHNRFTLPNTSFRAECR